MENTKTEIKWEKIIYVDFSHISDNGLVYNYIFFFNDENKVDVVLDTRTITCDCCFSHFWASRLDVNFEAVHKAIHNYIHVGDSYEKFTSIIFELNEKIIEAERKEQERKDAIIRERKAKEEELERKRKLEEEKQKAKLREKEMAEELRKEREKKAKLKTLPIEDVVGVCRFEFINGISDKKGEKILDMVKVNFLICEEYEFDDVKKIQNKILHEVAKRLSENYRFKKYRIPVGCFKARMFFNKCPKSISIVFTLKDELI